MAFAGHVPVTPSHVSWRWLIWVVPVAAVSLWIADTLLSHWLPANDLEVKSFDWQSQLAPHPKGAAPVIIEIDEDTNEALGMEPGSYRSRVPPGPNSLLSWTKPGRWCLSSTLRSGRKPLTTQGSRKPSKRRSAWRS
jgi:hypothetical protein